MTLFYFVQRGRFAGYWRRVPFSGRIADMRSQLTRRGHILTEAF